MFQYKKTTLQVLRLALTLFFSLSIVSCYEIDNNSTAMPSISATNPQLLSTSTPSPEPHQTTITYMISDEFLQNPERGFASEAMLTDSDYNEYYEDGVTLTYTTIRLDDYRETEIDQEFIDGLINFFEFIRLTGTKVVIRFAYNDGPYPDTEPDASLEQILKHIQQLKPLLQNNSDIIAWVEAGFIGAWGEWHTSTNNLDEDPSAKLAVLNALLDAVPKNRFVLLRYPVDIIRTFPSPLNSEIAFSSSSQSRVGFHNDCFLASPDDEETYARRGVYTYEQEIEYLSQSTQFVPVGGESCAYNPPRSDCPTALYELALLHFSELNDGWHPEVLQSWQDQGCYSEIENRLGYRLSLVESKANDRVLPGGIIDLTIKLNNTGFAPPINERPVYLMIQGAIESKVLLPVDPRFWFPEQISEFRVKIRVPINAPTGEYTLSLWLPDPSQTLQSDSRYSIVFANEDVFDESLRYNTIRKITVDDTTTGSVDVNAHSFEIIE